MKSNSIEHGFSTFLWMLRNVQNTPRFLRMLVLVFLKFGYVSLLRIFFLHSLLMRIDFTCSMPVVLWRHPGNCWWLHYQSKIVGPAKILTNQHNEPRNAVAIFLQNHNIVTAFLLRVFFGNRKKCILIFCYNLFWKLFLKLQFNFDLYYAWR